MPCLWVCGRKRVIPEDPPRLKVNAVVDEQTYRTIAGGTQLVSGEWYSYSRMQPQPRLETKSHILSTSSISEFRTTLLTSGQEVYAKQKSEAPRLHSRTFNANTLPRPRADVLLNRVQYSMKPSARTRLTDEVYRRKFPVSTRRLTTSAEDVVAESLHAAICRRGLQSGQDSSIKHSPAISGHQNSLLLTSRSPDSGTLVPRHDRPQIPPLTITVNAPMH